MVLAIDGLGPSSDWFRNIQAEVAIGRREFVPAHRVLDESEAADAIAGCERRNLLLRPVVHPVPSKLALRRLRCDPAPDARRRPSARRSRIRPRRY
ncbi:predicted protein [Streptomyces sp. AA4]|nr:predicted protein [Streptomyces sp. AA4]